MTQNQIAANAAWEQNRHNLQTESNDRNRTTNEFARTEESVAAGKHTRAMDWVNHALNLLRPGLSFGPIKVKHDW